jgi:transcriptional regulator with XRE-family HTH domain
MGLPPPIWQKPPSSIDYVLGIDPISWHLCSDYWNDSQVYCDISEIKLFTHSISWNANSMATEDDDTFGDTIRRARLELGLSLQAAADRLGMPKTTLWRLEDGESKISAKRLVDIAAEYGFSISRFVAGELVKSPTQTEFDRLGAVVEHVESMIQNLSARPLPARVRVAVVEVWRLETQRMIETGGDAFDPTRYDRIVEQIFAGTTQTDSEPAPKRGHNR